MEVWRPRYVHVREEGWRGVAFCREINHGKRNKTTPDFLSAIFVSTFLCYSATCLFTSCPHGNATCMWSHFFMPRHHVQTFFLSTKNRRDRARSVPVDVLHVHRFIGCASSPCAP